MIPYHLTRNPFPEAEWTPEMKPLVVLDGAAHSINELDTRITGDVAYVVGVNQHSFEHVLELVSARTIHFYEMRVADIGSLAGHPEIMELAIHWNTKMEDLTPIKSLPDLTHLVLEHTPGIHDLSALSECKNLEVLEYSGGMWSKNKAKSLEPLAQLSSLKKLRLLNLAVEHGGLKPIAALTHLEDLEVSNQFPAEEYAYLSVHLTDTACAHFAPYIKLEHPIGGKDAMVVGSRKPFLNLEEDADKLTRYEEKFERLRQTYSANKRSGGGAGQT